MPTARKPSRSKLGLLVLVGALLLGGGCASLPPRKPLPPEVEAARAALEGRAKAFHDLRTQADLRIRRGDRVNRLTGVLLLRAPAELRFEALAPFGPPILVVASNADMVTLWEVAQQRAVLARSSPDATKRWLGLALGPEELVALLAGNALPPRRVRNEGWTPAHLARFDFGRRATGRVDGRLSTSACRLSARRPASRHARRQARSRRALQGPAARYRIRPRADDADCPARCEYPRLPLTVPRSAWYSFLPC